jgi:hypothetical protein
MSAIWALSSFQARYQGVTDQMNDWDTQRISENLNIRNVDNTTLVEQFGAHNLNYNFSITVDNNGGETVNIVRIYVYNQSAPTNKTSKRLWIYNPINASAMQPRSGLNHSTINTGEVAHVIAVNGTKFRGSFQYGIILTTDRGRQFSYSYPPPSQSGGSGNYPIVMLADHDNFQYKIPTQDWKGAYSKPRSQGTKTLYRILLRNATNKTIIWWGNSTMQQLTSSGGTNKVTRYIVSNQTNVNNANPTALVSQEIHPGADQYVYFAGDAIVNPGWQDDPSTKGSYLLGFVLCFNYQGETEVRNTSLPVIIQDLT